MPCVKYWKINYTSKNKNIFTCCELFFIVYIDWLQWKNKFVFEKFTSIIIMNSIGIDNKIENHGIMIRKNISIDWSIHNIKLSFRLGTQSSRNGYILFRLLSYLRWKEDHSSRIKFILFQSWIFAFRQPSRFRITALLSKKAYWISECKRECN